MKGRYEYMADNLINFKLCDAPPIDEDPGVYFHRDSNNNRLYVKLPDKTIMDFTGELWTSITTAKFVNPHGEDITLEVTRGETYPLPTDPQPPDVLNDDSSRFYAFKNWAIVNSDGSYQDIDSNTTVSLNASKDHEIMGIWKYGFDVNHGMDHKSYTEFSSWETVKPNTLYASKNPHGTFDVYINEQQVVQGEDDFYRFNNKLIHGTRIKIDNIIPEKNYALQNIVVSGNVEYELLINDAGQVSGVELTLTDYTEVWLEWKCLTLYTVKLENADVESPEDLFSYGDKYTLPKPERTGYIFKGWLSGGENYSGGSEVTIESDVTFKATWGVDPMYVQDHNLNDIVTSCGIAYLEDIVAELAEAELFNAVSEKVESSFTAQLYHDTDSNTKVEVVLIQCNEDSLRFLVDTSFSKRLDNSATVKTYTDTSIYAWSSSCKLQVSGSADSISGGDLFESEDSTLSTVFDNVVTPILTKNSTRMWTKTPYGIAPHSSFCTILSDGSSTHNDINRAYRIILQFSVQ